jgi:hypothetical protein
MRHVLCLVGHHRWERHINPGTSGPGGGYDLCSRCGREKKSYEGEGQSLLRRIPARRTPALIGMSPSAPVWVGKVLRRPLFGRIDRPIRGK